LVCLQFYVLVLTLRLAVYTLFEKNKIKFGQKLFVSPKICTPVHLWPYTYLYLNLIHISICFSFDPCAYQTRSTTSSFPWFTRNNRHDTPNADAVNVFWVWRHCSRHAVRPTVILRFMKTCWNTLALSTRNLI